MGSVGRAVDRIWKACHPGVGTQEGGGGVLTRADGLSCSGVRHNGPPSLTARRRRGDGGGGSGRSRQQLQSEQPTTL